MSAVQYKKCSVWREILFIKQQQQFIGLNGVCADEWRRIVEYWTRKHCVCHNRLVMNKENVICLVDFRLTAFWRSTQHFSTAKAGEKRRRHPRRTRHSMYIFDVSTAKTVKKVDPKEACPSVKWYACTISRMLLCQEIPAKQMCHKYGNFFRASFFVFVFKRF